MLDGHSDKIWAAKHSPDGKRIVTASKDKSARVWDAVNGKLLAILKGHSNEVLSASFSPDSKCIVTASEDSTARIWVRNHPEQWWGVAWLPEFWLTLAISVGLGWSVWRDRKIAKS